MAFLPDVVSPCDACGGARFEPATLDIRYAGQSIGDVLRLSAEDAAQLFAAHPEDRAPARDLPRPRRGLRPDRSGVEHALWRGGAATQARGRAHAQAARTSRQSTSSTSRRPACTCRRPAAPDGARTPGRARRHAGRHRAPPRRHRGADWVIELGPEAGAPGGRSSSPGRPSGFPAPTPRLADTSPRRPAPAGSSWPNGAAKPYLHPEPSSPAILTRS